MPQPLRHLRTQLTLAALLPVLLLSALLSLPLLELRRSQLMEQARLRTVQAAAGAEQLLADRVAFGELAAGLLAGRPALVEPLGRGDRAALRVFLQQTRGNTIFDLLTVLDEGGAPLAQDGDAALWRPPLSRDAPVAVWRAPGRGVVVQVAAPVVADGGRVGTLVGDFALDAAFLAAARSRTDLGQSLLVNGALAASSLPARPAAAPGRLALADADPGAPADAAGGEAVVGGVPYLVRYQPVATRAGQQIAEVEVLLPLASVRQSQRRAALVILGGAALAGGGGALLSWLLARRIAAAIRQLGRAAERIGAGDLGAPVRVAGPSELTSLGAAIDRMREQLAFTHAALGAETARYLNILESTRDATLVLDRAGRVVLANEAAEALLGARRERLAHAPLAAAVALHGGEPLDPERIPTVGDVHLAIQTADGRVLTVAASRAPVRTEAAGAAGEQIVVLRDISDAVALGALKEEFLANVTHEFRTPLAAVIASLEILRHEHGELSPAEQGQMLDTVQVGVRRLDTLVQNLLDSASIQAGYFRVQPEVTRVEPLVDEAVALMGPLLAQRGQRVQVLVAPGLPLVLADEQRIVQVLVNLLSNASKFGPRGDRITLAATAGGAEVELAVTDHGPGIPASRHPGLFERFLRPGSATVRAQGVGLGLAIVKAIVERHGQQVAVRADPRRGTTFSFTLRAEPAPAGAPDTAYERAYG